MNIRTTYLYIFLGILFHLIIPNESSAALQQDSLLLLTKPPRELKSVDIIKGDTVDLNMPKNDDKTLPGGSEIEYTAEQDSAYIRDLKLSMPIGSRIEYSLSLHDRRINEMIEISQKSPWGTAIANLENIPKELYKPGAVEKVLYDYNLQAAQTIPFVYTPNPYGLKIPLSDIGVFFGLTEDVSPVIKYELDFAADVEIVIYSLSAAVIAKLFDGHQSAGKYTISWNGRNDKGMKMPSGDYIAEVRIGKVKYVRKRILIP